MAQDNRDPRTYAIIGAAMEVHSQLGNGFLEPVYQDALEVEFRLRKIQHAREVALPVFYKEQQLRSSYRADFICFENVIVELKAVKQITDIERAQILNYLKATNFTLGLLINFGQSSLKYERFVN